MHLSPKIYASLSPKYVHLSPKYVSLSPKYVSLSPKYACLLNMLVCLLNMLVCLLNMLVGILNMLVCFINNQFLFAVQFTFGKTKVCYSVQFPFLGFYSVRLSLSVKHRKAVYITSQNLALVASFLLGHFMSWQQASVSQGQTAHTIVHVTTLR